MVRDLASLPNLKSLDFSDCDMDVESALELFQSTSRFRFFNGLVLPDVPEMTDWGIVAEALTTSKTLERVEMYFIGREGRWLGQGP